MKSRNREIAARFDAIAPSRPRWLRRARYYYETLTRFYRDRIPPGSDVLEIGCGTGNLLASLSPRRGVGLDLSGGMLSRAREEHPSLRWIRADAHRLPLKMKFDAIVASDLMGHLDDVYAALREIRAIASPGTRLIITNFNSFWEGPLKVAERLGLKTPVMMQNWLDVDDLANLLTLCDFVVEEKGFLLFCPKRLWGIGTLLNMLAARCPFLRRFSFILYLVASPSPRPPQRPLSCSIIIPCHNEEGNIARCVEELPSLGTETELIFVDDASTDGTAATIARLGAGRPAVRLVSISPRGGKGRGVREGFMHATGDVLIIFDADLTVPPDDLPKFFDVLASGKARFVNGSRMVYPLEKGAMKSVNKVGNKIFSIIFSWLLGQRIKDTLCGTKALFREDYLRMPYRNDPWGDFYILFGASQLGLAIVDMPVRYARRVSGRSKMRVVKHGAILSLMCLVGLRDLKLKPFLNRLRNRTARR